MARYLLFAVARVSAECAGGGKFAKFMTHHVFSYIYGDKLVAIVYCESVADKLGGNHRSAAPSLDNGLLAGFLHSGDLLFELNADKRAFFQ